MHGPGGQATRTLHRLAEATQEYFAATSPSVPAGHTRIVLWTENSEFLSPFNDALYAIYSQLQARPTVFSNRAIVREICGEVLSASAFESGRRAEFRAILRDCLTQAETPA